MRHGHGGGRQRLLARRLRRLQRARAGQHGLRHLQPRVRVRRGLCLEGHLRLSRRGGQGEGLGRPGVGQQGLGGQAVRGRLRLAVQRGLRRGRLALRHAQGLQGRVRGREALRVQRGGLLDVRVRAGGRGGLRLPRGLGHRRGRLRGGRGCAGRGWRRRQRGWHRRRGCGGLGRAARGLQHLRLRLQHLLLSRGIRVALIVLGAGDAGGRAAVVLVDVLGVAAPLVVDAAAVGALAFALSLRGGVGPADLLWGELQ